MLDSSMENLTQLLGPPGVRWSFWPEFSLVFWKDLKLIWFHQGCPKKGTLKFFMSLCPNKNQESDKISNLVCQYSVLGINKMDIVLLLFLFLN